MSPELTQLAPTGEGGPYKFLDYFEEKDESTFAGRDRDIKEIAARVMVDRTVVLYGRSGLGKTSLVFAGLFPEFRRRELVPVYCRVLQNPQTDVEEALCEALDLVEPGHLLGTLQEKKAVLVLDQFEEFFVRFDKIPEARQALVDLLKNLLGDEKSGLRVLISLREDYLARLDELKEQLPAFFLTDYRLGQLTAFGARQAITRPLTQKGIRYEPRLISQILEIVSAEDFDSLLLQLICTAVASEANRCGRPGELKAEDLKAVGGLDGILGRYLDAATKEIPDNLRLLTRTLLDALITSENTKRAVTLSALQQWDTEAKPKELSGSLDILRRKRLVREERRGNNVWFELTHERLVNPILRWFELDRTFADFRFAREMVANGSRSGMYRTRSEALLTKETLDNLIGPLRDRLRPDEKQIEYLFWSAVYRRSDEAEFWAKRLSSETCDSILVEFFKRQDPTARAGAAHFAFLLPGSAAAKQCLNLSLTDKAQEVRQEAGRTLARLAGATEISALKAALRRRATRRWALEALACFPEDSKWLPKFAWRSRLLARRVARRRLFAASGNLRALHMRSGALSGLISSMVWAFAFLPVILCLATWNSGVAEYFPLLDPQVVSNLGLVFGIGVPIMIVMSVLIGVMVGRGTARVAVLSKPFGWWRACLYLFLISGVLITATLYLTHTREGIENSWVISLLVSVIAVLHIRFGAAGMLRSASTIKRWTIGLFHCTTPFLIAGTIGLTASVWIGDEGEWFAVGVFSGALWSIVFYSWSTSLVESALPDAETPKDRLRLIGGRWSAAASIVAVALSVISYFLAFGPTSIPAFAETASVGSAGFTVEPHSLSLHRVPNAVFFKVDLPQNSTPVYETVGVPDNVELQFRNVIGRSIFFLPPGKLLGSVSAIGRGSANLFSGGWRGNSFKLNFRSVPILDGRNAPATDQYQFALVTLQKNTSGDPKQPPVWSGQIAGQLTPMSDSALEIIPLVEHTPYRVVENRPVRARGSTMTGILAVAIPAMSQSRKLPPDFVNQEFQIYGQGNVSVAQGNASVVQGKSPFAFEPLDFVQPWRIHSQRGNISLSLRFRFVTSGQEDSPGFDRLPESRYSKDEVDRLPSQVLIAVALRVIKNRQ